MIASLPRRSSPGVDAQVRNERIRVLYRQAVTTVTASVAVAGLLAALMWPRVPMADAIAWLALFTAITAARYVSLAAHARFGERRPPQYWDNIFRAGAFLAGCSWGLSAIWLFPKSEPEYQFFVVIVGMGLAAGAASSLSTSFWAYLLFLFPTVLPPSVRILFEPGMLTHVAGITSIVYCVAMVGVGINNARTMSTALRLRFSNLELAHELEALATRDSLTGLPNRLILVERLQTALKRADRGEHDVAVAFVDCDGFKKINDTYGHQAGDEYLKRVGDMLRACVRDVDTVARLGGDEFIVLLERCGSRSDVERIVRRMLEATTHDIRIGNAAVRPRFSMGVSCYPCDGTDPETLIKQADEAMYAAKRAGGNAVRFFIPLAVQASG